MVLLVEMVQVAPGRDGRVSGYSRRDPALRVEALSAPDRPRPVQVGAHQAGPLGLLVVIVVTVEWAGRP